MKAPRNGDSCLARPLTSAEASSWLTGLLKGPSNQNLTTHGLKSTSLSWCAKAGLSREVREVLGRHSAGVKSTSAVYSCDLQAGPLRRFVTLLKKIRLRIFDPDAGRGGRWTVDVDKDGDSKCGYAPSVSTLHSPSTPVVFPKVATQVSPSVASWEMVLQTNRKSSVRKKPQLLRNDVSRTMRHVTVIPNAICHRWMTLRKRKMEWRTSRTLQD